MVPPNDLFDAGTIFSRSPLFTDEGRRRDGRIVCREVARLAEQLLGGATAAIPVFVAVVGCVLGRYRARDRVRLAVSLPGVGGEDRRGAAEAAIVIDLPVSPDGGFSELAAIASKALDGSKGAAVAGDGVDGPTERLAVEGDAPVDAVVTWQEGEWSPMTPCRAIGYDRVDLLFDFVRDANVLRLAVRAAGAANHRISPAVIGDVVSEIAQCLSEEPSATIGQLRLVSPAWRRKLLVEFNGQPVPHRKDRTILDLFEECAARAGNRPAITSGEDRLSYAKLNGKANALASRLHDAGVGKGDLIPVVTGGGVELPIAMIALMKLGAAFVPVDAAWPDERLQVIFDELKPKLALYENPAQVAVAKIPSLSFSASLLEERADKPTSVTLLPDSLIYGFFTSGSTGIPKCALNLHGGLLNRFLAMSRRFGATGDDVVLQNSKHVFDSSIWQLLWPLTTGSQVVMPRATGLLDLSYIVSLIERHGITMTDFVPSIFNTLVDLMEAHRAIIPRLASLRHLLIGGEEIGAKAVQKFRDFLPGCGVTNTYGPTEASIGCVFHEVRDEDGWSIPIGKPIDNCYVAILDPRGMLVPPGVVGEIMIGGDCLGRGYLNDPVKTGAAFVVNTLAEIPGERLYKTGDLGYHRADGNIFFVGREDHQVKLGGVRIELAEIETAIAAHPAVRAVKVVVEGRREELQRLVAYVVADAGISPKDIKQTVAGTLPAYCVPKQVFMIDRIPLTPNGKADRKALAAMARRHGEPPADEAITEAERRIRAAWLRLLALDDAGVRDDFFDLGGDSLAAIRLAMQLSSDFSGKVSARDVYHHRTIRAQAALVDKRLERAPLPAGDDPETTLRAAARLDPAIHASPGTAAETASLVLLTGATGFVGSHLLRKILEYTSARVICLARAENDAAAAARVRQALRHYRLEDDDGLERVTAVAGNLELPRLGIPKSVYNDLAGAVDAVVHNGASVNFLLDYQTLHSVNVGGTTEIIRLAAARRPKRLHYISTLSAIDVETCASFDETELAAEARFPAGGYGQSKSVAERLVSEARRRGVAATTYRLGEVMPHSRTGIANSQALFDTLIRSCLKLGLSFATPLRFDYTPVDYIARFVAAAVAAPTPPVSVFHVFHPEGQALETIFESLRNAGFPLRPVSYRSFHEALRRACDGPAADQDLLLTAALMPEPAEADAARTDAKVAQIFANAGLRFSCANTLAALDRWGIRWPSPRLGALDAYAAFHRDRGHRTSKVEQKSAAG